MRSNVPVWFHCVFILLRLYDISDAGQLCGQCRQLIDPRDCNYVSECGNNEKCLLTSYVTPGGLVLHDLGCISNQQCTNRREIREPVPVETSAKKRNIHGVPVCQACCNDTKICNVKGGFCGTAALGFKDTIICYHCEDMQHPGDCDKVEMCPIANQCYLGKKFNYLSGRYVWESRCGQNATECTDRKPSFPGFTEVGKRKISPCPTCCSKDFCNKKCSEHAILPDATSSSIGTTPNTNASLASRKTSILPIMTTGIPPIESSRTQQTATSLSPTTLSLPQSSSSVAYLSSPTKSSLTAPTITSINLPKTIVIGDHVLIDCKAHGVPTPTIHWKFLSSTGAVPYNVELINGTVLSINPFEAKDTGSYSCVASNSVGYDAKFALLSAGKSVITPNATYPLPVVTYTRQHSSDRYMFIVINAQAERSLLISVNDN